MTIQPDLSLIVAIVGSAVAIVGVVVGMFLWLRGEANSDRRKFDEIQREDRKDLLQISRNIENAIYGIQNEMRDFHHQLVDIQKKVG
jgi:hypothetical protein